MKNNAIDVLNSLIEVNNDRIEGYRTASEETKDADLKSLFTDYVQVSQRCKADLIKEVNNLGGTPAEGTSASGKVYRAWMDIRSALSSNDRLAVLKSCEYGEDAAVSSYKDALYDHKADLTISQQSLINEQYNKIKEGHDKMRALRDKELAHS